MTTTTHEQFVQRVRDLVLDHAELTDDEAHRLRHTKLVYGVGNGAYRGICHYEAWENGVGRVDVVEIAATAEESWVQLAGTTVHELAHVLTRGGHDRAWKDAAVRLGFVKRPEAAGQRYWLAMIRPQIRQAIYRLAQEIGDGSPAFATFGGFGIVVKVRPCSAGTGVKGGRSRGKGSGSRMRLYECECSPKPFKVRVASDDFAAHCDACGAAFTRKDLAASERLAA